MAAGKQQKGLDDDLRSHLRAATMAAHDLLDHAMQEASGWQQREDYARFLELQHAARAPIEDWLDAHAPDGLNPPHQTPLIAHDLAALGRPAPEPAPMFTIGRTGAGHALGAAWVLAGSALGNRSIAKQVRRIGGGAWPMAFLGDDAMLGFWQALRSRIEQHPGTDEAEGATDAATAVFAHFLALAEKAQTAEAVA
ncbi:biliverdin-producing heme oxygenase [Erythrobacter sp. sf7]|uniref:Biliverdin-producing heme oxygenase n=1 Tax=Erythrobacter fulvus TaxID=2987523 RepID=A0ABT5JQM7_9SPHN|nr:biliverdin-producing heme oxygenase [Erythrobacter fulvus]MDC8754829.1 biliverdin-producing heme oxygenase [Erythrobacter fulvus]